MTLMRKGPSIIIRQVHEACTKYPDGTTVAQLAEDTGLTAKQVHSCVRRDSGWFKTTKNADRTVHVMALQKKPSPKFAPVMGAKKQYRLENEVHVVQQAYQATQAPSDEYGHFEVRYTNGAGMAVSQPAQSMSYAKLLQSENENSTIVKVR